MEPKRKMALVGRKLSFKEAEEQEVLQWLEVSFEERWESLERLRRMFCQLNNIPYTGKMERVLKIGRH